MGWRVMLMMGYTEIIFQKMPISPIYLVYRYCNRAMSGMLFGPAHYFRRDIHSRERFSPLG